LDGDTLPEKLVLYRFLDGSVIEVDLPLTDYADIASMMRDLGIPDYVDLMYFPMKRAIVTIWAARNAYRLHELYPEKVPKRITKDRLNVALFGGGAVKVHSESANRVAFLNRVMKDVDLLYYKKHGYNFYRLLLMLGDIFGTKYYHFVIPSDKMFNAFRHGDRYRLRAFDDFDDGRPIVGVMDLIADTIEMRHKVKCTDELKAPDRHLYTIGLENIVLSKAQYIMDLDQEYLEKLRMDGQDFRVINYPYYAPNKIIIGMELKDMKDVFSVFLDHELTSDGGKEELSIKKIVKKLKSDKKMALTVRLNLETFIESVDNIFSKEVGSSRAENVKDKVRELLRHMPEVNKKWDKPWWNVSVETPDTSI
jgi:hypothetical protein